MTNENILKQVITLLSKMTDANEIQADSEIIDDLDISSMDVLVLICHIEEEFEIKISEKKIRKIVTVNDIVNIIAELLP